jgi:uncharacterized membrane protein YheB (UPF0754 family)
MNVEILIRLFLIVGIGAGIGWITNYVAIKMLFRPYKEINFGLFKIQGLLPKRKHEIGESLAQIIQDELVSLKDIVDSMDKSQIEEKLDVAINQMLDNKLYAAIKKFYPMAAMFIGNDTLEKIKSIITDAILQNTDKIINLFSEYLEGNVDFKGIIVRNVDAFSLEKLEEVTYMLAKREFKHIEIIGAILGAVIGFIQFLIGFLI